MTADKLALQARFVERMLAGDRLPAAARHAWLTMSVLAGEDGRLPDVATIKNATGMHQDIVALALDELRDGGWLVGVTLTVPEEERP